MKLKTIKKFKTTKDYKASTYERIISKELTSDTKTFINQEGRAEVLPVYKYEVEIFSSKTKEELEDRLLHDIYPRDVIERIVLDYLSCPNNPTYKNAFEVLRDYRIQCANQLKVFLTERETLLQEK